MPPPMLRNSRPEFGGMLLGAVAIVLASTALGLTVNHFSASPLPVLVQVKGEQLPLPPGITALSLLDAKRMYEANEAPFIDARQPDWYAKDGHIPGAINLPADSFEKRFLAQADRLEAAPKLVVYCESSDCGEALATVERLKEAYQGQILLYVGGWLEWSAAKYPTRKGESP